MTSFTRGLYIAFAVSSFGNLGCGPVAPEESVAQTREAITIGSWNDLLTKLGTTGSFTLTANITAPSNASWTPKDFSGTFDGGNHTISNLSVNGGGFFRFLDNATVSNLRLINLTVSGSSLGTMGGLAASAAESTVQNCAVEMNITFNAIAVGGFFGMMTGGSIFRSYAKGTVTGTMDFAGGLVGIMNPSSTGEHGSIVESYGQVTVNPNTSNAAAIVTAGGLVGRAMEPDIHDAYAVGSVTGRGAVGGIVGDIQCNPNYTEFFVYKTIYRGDVVDRNWTPNMGWAGNVGIFQDCTGRFLQNFYDRSLDPSAHIASRGVEGHTTFELRSPTSVIGGVFCAYDYAMPERCGDNTWSDPPWDPGTASQHHVLRNMPGPNVQPR